MEQIFGERLRVIRKRRGMTQADLAQALGITVQTVVRYEGLRAEEVRPGRLEEIAKALDVPVEELTGTAEEAAEDSIQMLTRGLRKMDPEQRENLIGLMMPIIRAYQRGGLADE